MKEYPKEYEDWLTSKDYRKSCDIDGITIEGMSNDDYRKKVHDMMYSYSKMVYEHFITLLWHYGQLKYRGKRRDVKSKKASMRSDIAFGSFNKCMVGCDQRLITWDHKYYVLKDYFWDQYPDLLDANPDDGTLVYPYEYITIDQMIFVNKMDERLDLLKISDERKMGYAEFYDYVLNYICCYNEEHGEKYHLKEPVTSHVFSRWTPYIGRTKKDGK